MILKILYVASVVFAAACVSQMAKPENSHPGTKAEPQTVNIAKQPVLIELFTSEGCSSCPPADRVLTLLEKQQPVNSADSITLEFHVDYWDGPEWKDPFSAHLFTQRQQEYSNAFKLDADYTPQMVVDGRSQFVGSDLPRATGIIEKFAGEPKSRIEIGVSGNAVKISLANLPAHEPATVFLAAAEDNLTSSVSGGENSGSKLSHTSVVRELKAVGLVEKSADKFAAETALSAQTGWKKENLRYVVFVQENTSRKVLAVSRVSN